ncbi:MAG: hypothetical protein GXP33_10845 [Spirochaetes bacterium]|nr:hypothetical protein [Spirochaetota bacterium]
MLGTWELILIIAILILIFGTKRILNAGHFIGKELKNFRALLVSRRKNN